MDDRERLEKMAAMMLSAENEYELKTTRDKVLAEAKRLGVGLHDLARRMVGPTPRPDPFVAERRAAADRRAQEAAHEAAKAEAKAKREQLKAKQDQVVRMAQYCFDHRLTFGWMTKKELEGLGVKVTTEEQYRQFSFIVQMIERRAWGGMNGEYLPSASQMRWLMGMYSQVVAKFGPPPEPPPTPTQGGFEFEPAK